jgi:hypothetical protein
MTFKMYGNWINVLPKVTSFSSEYFIFLRRTYTPKYQNIQKYNFNCCLYEYEI